jgi:hypothetical protein
MATTPINNPSPEQFMIAYVIQGDDVFRVTADNVVYTTSAASDGAFDGVAKLKAAAALMELTNKHKERPTELRRMARELATEGMRLLARCDALPRSSSSVVVEMPEATVA